MVSAGPTHRTTMTGLISNAERDQPALRSAKDPDSLLFRGSIPIKATRVIASYRRAVVSDGRPPTAKGAGLRSATEMQHGHG